MGHYCGVLFSSPAQCRKYKYSFDLYKAVQLSKVVTSLCSIVDDSLDQCNIEQYSTVE